VREFRDSRGPVVSSLKEGRSVGDVLLVNFIYEGLVYVFLGLLLQGIDLVSYAVEVQLERSNLIGRGLLLSR